MYHISIPTPCHEDWNDMTPNQNGRHCSSCAKTVVDFSAMSDEQVKDYLLTRSSESLCGRLNQKQLSRIQVYLPEGIYHKQMANWKKFLLACLVAFSTTLFSCDITTGKHTKPEEEMHQTTGLIVEENLLGKILSPKQDTLPRMNKPEVTVTNTQQVAWDTSYIMGGMQMTPVPIIEHDELPLPPAEEMNTADSTDKNVVGGLRIIEINNSDRTMHIIPTATKPAAVNCPDTLKSYE